jgi:hypothetical protein
VQAVDAFWAGQYEDFEHALERYMPAVFRLPPDRMVINPAAREGIGFRADLINAYAKNVTPFMMAWRYGMTMEVAATESANEASAAVERLGALVDGFRANIKNDLASMKAASERIQGEVQRMEVRYKQAQDLLTGHDFERAVLNAERMVVALEAISKLSETKLSVAVFSGSKTA